MGNYAILFKHILQKRSPVPRFTSDAELFKKLFPKKAKKDANKVEIFFQTLRGNFPNTDFFWSVFSPNTGKYGPEETSYLDAFQAVKIVRKREWPISISLVL